MGTRLGHKIPLHLKPDDHSPETTFARILHRHSMAQLNLQGFIQYGKKRGVTKRKLRRVLRSDRLIAQLDA